MLLHRSFAFSARYAPSLTRALLFTVVLLLTTLATANADVVTFTWTKPTTNEDLTPLTDLAGFSLHAGTQTGVYSIKSDVGDTTTGSLNLTAGVKYFVVVTAFDTAGNRSKYSNEISVTPGGASSLTLKPQLEAGTPAGKTFTINAYNTADNSLIKTFTVVADSQGSVTFSTSGLPSVVNLSLKASGYLRRLLNNYNTASAGAFPVLLAGDLNNDNGVNIYDHSAISAAWLRTGDPADLNGDGKVNIYDFDYLSKNWLKKGE